MPSLRISFSLLLVAHCAAVLALFAQAAANPSPERIDLRDGWAIQSSADVRDTGAAISMPGYSARNWYPAALPSTVLRALVNNHVYADPYVGTNMRSIAGTTYPVFSNFSEVPMPPESPFRHSWWYRTEFKLPAAYKGKMLWLGFDGINYRANVWLNGTRVASSDEIAGTWRLFEFNVTAVSRPGATNSLAVEVFPPQPSDLAITLVDWAPMPPDKEMGIWRDVHISATGPVAIRYPAVITKVYDSLDQAELTVRAELKNATEAAVHGVLNGYIQDIEFSQPVELRAGETRIMLLSAQQFPQLKLAKPRLWWPWQMGRPDLYPLDLRFEIGGRVSDSAHIRIGIRRVTSEITPRGHLRFFINGNPILIRGAGYSFDMLLRSSPERQQAELNYVRDLNLNAIRLEGKFEDDHFLDLCDEMGILVMPGWCCCDRWEEWDKWDAENEKVAAESTRDQIRRIERHPSVFTFLLGSDFPPPPRVEQMYLGILRGCSWPNPIVSSASGKATPQGPSGVKMTGPYEYVAPSFWYLDTSYGGAYGFNTETSPGPAIPPIESLRRMLPEDHLWPVDSVWEYHAGGMSNTLKVFSDALDHRYGVSASVEEFAYKAQIQAYETHRAMMEAYSRNKYTSTGIIQWMLNNAWPSMIWHMYDWYLRPGGSYFGVKKACEPLHVQYSYDDRSVVVVNSLYKPVPNVKVSASVYNLDMTRKFAKEAVLEIGSDSSTRVFTIPEGAGTALGASPESSPGRPGSRAGTLSVCDTYFLDLRLESSGELASRNFYWLSTAPEAIDWGRGERDSTGVYAISSWTPTKTYADYRALNTLPQVDVEATLESRRYETAGSTIVTLHNPTNTIAFGIRLKVVRATEERAGRAEDTDDELLPVLWEDNYFPLLPNETRRIAATYSVKDLPAKQSVRVEIMGWNVKPKVVAP